MVDSIAAPFITLPALELAQVLITSINYPPEHAGIGPYVGDIAEHLAAAGHQVRVITGVPHYPSWTTSGEYRRRARTDEYHAGVHVTRMRHYVPARQTALRRGAYEASFFANACRVRVDPSPDVVLSISPSLSSALVGQRLARRHGARSVVFVQDLMGAAARQSGITSGGRVARLADRIEAGVVHAADRVVVPHESFRARVLELGADPGRVEVVPNWTHIADATGSREATRQGLGWGDRLVCLHAGNMGLKQGLEVVVDAARRALVSDPAMLFVLLGDGSQRRQLEAMGADLPNLRFVDPVSDEAFPEVLAAADVLLLTQRPAVLDMSLPSKLTSYFAAGRPVVASVSPLGGTAAEVRRSGGGVTVAPGDPDELVRALRQLGGDDAGRERLGVAGRGFAREHLGRVASLARLEELLGLRQAVSVV